MQLELELASSARPALLISASPEAAWRAAAAEWFRGASSEAWKNSKPTVVAVPTRGQAQALKGALLAEGGSAFGVEFLTPPYLRELLRTANESQLTRAEHLRLLLALAAEELVAARSLSEPERLAAVSVRRTPNHLLHLLDQLAAAGVAFEEVDLPAFRPVVQKFGQRLAALGLALPAELDRRTLARACEREPVISRLLVTGFHGGHWAVWHLLQAAVAVAAEATVLLQYPRTEASDLDSAWVGSWENRFGEARPAEERDALSSEERATIFLVGLDTREQANAIVAAAHHFLANPLCTRLGILFPAAGALPRLVAASLSDDEIPHYDAMGELVPGLFEAGVFRTWLELQRTPRLNVLRRFLTSLGSDHAIFADVTRRGIIDGLEQSLGSIAIDDLALLTASIGAQSEKGKSIAVALECIRFLPERATLAEFLGATQIAFLLLDWAERWREIEQRGAWAASLDSVFSRTLFLRWLEETAVSFRVARAEEGQHAYARVHLLTPAQAEDQTWSHLIFTNLNEGLWPVAGSGDFLPATSVEALKGSLQNINRTATKRGRHGEGDVVVREGRALFLGAAQQRLLGEAQFLALRESASVGLAFTASVVQEETPERVSNPSEFFNRIYHELHGMAPSQQMMRALREVTRRWVEQAGLGKTSGGPETSSIGQTRVAYAARRELKPSDEYDFSLRAPLHGARALSVSEAEDLLKSPALVWLRHYLGVEGEEDSAHAWNATIGKWTHAWLAEVLASGGAFARRPHGDEMGERLQQVAARKSSEVEQLCREAHRVVPDWWKSGWDHAACLAQTLGRVLATAEDWPWAVTEWRLETQCLDVGEGQSLCLRGRADLVLAKGAAPPSSMDLPEVWIVDFKTGNKMLVAPKYPVKTDDERARFRQRVRKAVLKREALQLWLYALAARELGAEHVHVSLISPLVTTAKPQLSLDDFADCDAALRELARMQATGIYGMCGSLRNPYGFTKNYPLATLSVDPEILDDRWEMTHPALALDEEGW